MCNQVEKPVFNVICINMIPSHCKGKVMCVVCLYCGIIPRKGLKARGRLGKLIISGGVGSGGKILKL